MNPIKVGVIGCGYWGPKLARNFSQMPGTQLSWLSDYREDRLAHVKELYPGAKATRDYRDLLASDVEAVVIATPVLAHHPQDAIAREAGTRFREPLPRPDDDIVRDTRQQNHHLLGGEFSLIPFGQPQTLFVTFDLNLHPTGALIVDAQTRKVIFDNKKCIACELCVPICPPRAMEVHF